MAMVQLVTILTNLHLCQAMLGLSVQQKVVKMCIIIFLLLFH